MGNIISSCWPWRKADRNLKKENLEVVQYKPAVPSTQQYCIKATQKTILSLQSAASFVPVPFAKEVLGVVLTLINLCEQVTALQSQLDDFRDHLCTLGLIIFHSVERKAMAPVTEARLTKLRAKLEEITLNLQSIQDQSKLVLGVFADVNKECVNDCVHQLKTALTEFRLSHDISTEQDLDNILQRLEEMSSQLNHVDEGVQEANHGIKELMTLMRNSQPHTASVIASSGKPAQLLHFRGRPGMVPDIGNMLCSDDPTKTRVAVLATGGIGKTALAVEVMESEIVERKFSEGNRFWVSCKGAISLIIFLQVLTTSLRIKTNLGDFHADILNELTASDTPRLIILDNFETPWETSEKNDVERVLCSLAKLPYISILLTMRSNHPPSKNIHWTVQHLLPIDPDASRQIYSDIDPSAASHEDLDELLSALGHMPYAVKLLATLGNESNIAPDELLRMWKKGGTGILEDEEISRSIGLSVDSKLMQSHPEAQSLFKILSMLPAGTTRDRLSWWAPELGEKLPLAISILNRTALISTSGEPSKPTIFVYPVVQSYVEHSAYILLRDRITLQEAAFKFVLAHKSSPGDPNFKDDLRALMTEDINLQGILTSAARQRLQYHDSPPTIENPDEMLLDALVTFGLYQLWSKPCLGVADLAVEVARHLNSQHHLAEALSCLGQIFHHLAKYDEERIALREARLLFQSISNPLRASQARFQIIFSYGFHRDNHSQQLNDLIEEIRTDVVTLDNPQLRGIALLTRGFASWTVTFDYDEALKYLSSAQEAFEGIGHTFDIAQCFYTICYCYLRKGMYSEALDAAKHAVKEWKCLGLDGQANISRELEAVCLLMVGDYDEALQVSEDCLKEARVMGDILTTAKAFESIAEVFEHRRDIILVRLAYESALDQYKAIGNAGLSQRGRKRCEHNLSVLNAAQDENDIHSLMQQMEHRASTKIVC